MGESFRVVEYSFHFGVDYSFVFEGCVVSVPRGTSGFIGAIGIGVLYIILSLLPRLSLQSLD